MALESWLVTFLRAGIPNCNHIIVLTIQPEKPLKGESDFFPDTQGSRSLPFVVSSHAARQKPLKSLFQDMTTVGILRYGVSVHRQHDEAPQVCRLLSLAEERHRVGCDAGCRVPLQAQVVLACKLDGKFLECDFVSRQKRLYRSEVVEVR